MKDNERAAKNIIVILTLILTLPIILLTLYFSIIHVAIFGKKEQNSCFVNIFGQRYKHMVSPLWDGESGGTVYKKVRKEECN